MILDPSKPRAATSLEAVVHTDPHDKKILLRAQLTRLLSEATPRGWVVTEGKRYLDGAGAVALDIAVQPLSTEGLPGLPILCLDMHADEMTSQTKAQLARRRVLAHLGVDHHWSLYTASETLDVWVRAGGEYRHAETMTDAGWLDYGIGILHLNVQTLLET